MSLEDNSSWKAGSTCQFYTEATTRIFKNTHHVKWTLENVSEQLEFEEINGPKFTFGQIKMNLFMKIGNEKKMIRLRSTADQHTPIEVKLVLSDCENSKLQETDMNHDNEARTFNLVASLDLIPDDLKDDKLIIDCYLTFLKPRTRQKGSLQPQEKCSENLLNDFKMLYKNPDYSDFRIEVGDDFIPAHKAILSFRSGYFKTLFDVDMREKKESSVIIRDTSLSTMQKLVEFLYTGNFTLKEEDDKFQELMNLYVAADKYQVMDLRSSCENQLMSAATVENILEVLQIADCHNDEQFKNEAKDFAVFYADKILKSNDWKTFLSKNPSLSTEVLNSYFKHL